nr:oligosaccharide flippase family protein [uncultured Fusobacterium sp.]
MNNKLKLLQNTIFLYILTFSSQFFNLLIIPYQARILGPEIFGKVGFILSIMLYVQLILDFGFLLSGTEAITKNLNNNIKIRSIFTNIFVIKIILSIFLYFLLFILKFRIKVLSEEYIFFTLYYISFVINSFLPDFIYRGLEEMKILTLRTIFIKIVITIFVFIFLREKDDYLVLPIFNIFGNILALLIMLYHLKRNFNIYFDINKINIKVIIKYSERTIPFFLSRIASTFYTAMNTFILGIYYPNTNVLGYYTSADKLVVASKSFVSPVADSFYPYMLKHKDFKLVKKILMITIPIILIGGMILYYFSNDIVTLIFGIEYQEVGSLLRYLLPIIIVIFPSYLIAFPVMAPLGLSKYTNYSNLLGAALHMLMFSYILVTGELNAKNVCVISSITEVFIFLYRMLVIFLYKIKN